MAHLLAARSRGTAGGGLEALQDGALIDKGGFHDQRVGREVVVVLGVRDGALERLVDELGGLARDEREILGRLGGAATGDGADNLADLLRGHASVAGDGGDFHGMRFLF